ncbi:class I SAM-dependent methyltransferase [Halosquirtibacter laminarini]|uniref:Class I SAM-dependent methyltransferase n=1 Tax=Halosquirtibacter laminarini TaxID=3374600 RepID=A0AC61NNN1_9BACT|nr:class I SAM-dependent methyltransferase [Prolixibacteraceae bacterium]
MSEEMDFELICEYYSQLDRQGPGSKETTLKALDFIGPLSENAKVTDLGCGTGGQTITLAEALPCNITGVDIFPQFLNKLNDQSELHGLSKRLHAVQGSMEDLPFDKNSLDLIWSEGAIYNIGFEQGLRLWHEYLKVGGYVAVTEISWLTENRTEEIETYWNGAYPGIDTIPNKMQQLQSAGYIPVASFVIPESCWLENYYGAQKEVQESFLKNHTSNPNAIKLIEEQREEEALYRKYKDYYGYVFYIGKRVG